MTLAKLNNIDSTIWSSTKNLGVTTLDSIDNSIRTVGSISRAFRHTVEIVESSAQQSSIEAKLTLADTYYSASAKLQKDHLLTEEQVQAWLLS